jgi:hypothetical protein
MKKIIFSLIVVMFLNGCGLDETNQEDHQSHVYQKDRAKKEIVKEYYDENGDQITDPDIISEIENKEKDKN